MKVAETLRAMVMVTVHAPVPVQSPVHPVNDEPVLAAGVSVTSVTSVTSVP